MSKLDFPPLTNQVACLSKLPFIDIYIHFNYTLEEEDEDEDCLVASLASHAGRSGTWSGATCYIGPLEIEISKMTKTTFVLVMRTRLVMPGIKATRHSLQKDLFTSGVLKL